MFNLLILAACFWAAVRIMEFYCRLTSKFEKWQRNHKFYAEFKKQKEKIKKQNMRTLCECIGMAIAFNYRNINGKMIPSREQLERMMKRELEQMIDFGLIDDMNRCKKEIIF